MVGGMMILVNVGLGVQLGVIIGEWLACIGEGNKVAVDDGAIVKLGRRGVLVEAVTAVLQPHVRRMAIKTEIPASLFIINSY
jgi:hypothetical protein